MIYYPVLIPTLNRYEHLKRLIESLGHNTHAKETVLVIGLDYPPSDKYVDGWKRIKEYLPTVTGFKDVKILCAQENLGVRGNMSSLMNYVKTIGYDAYIVTEDDNEFSPCFLDYMNKALMKFKNDDRVVSVSGYTWDHIKINSKKNVMLVTGMAAWGIGRWFDKEIYKDIDYYFNILESFQQSLFCACKMPSAFLTLLAMIRRGTKYGDAMSAVYCLINNKYELMPTYSLVRNWGDDGSGLHCGQESRNHLKAISKAKYFDLDEVDFTSDCNPYIRKVSKIKHVSRIIKAFLFYISTRINLNKYKNLYSENLV